MVKVTDSHCQCVRCENFVECQGCRRWRILRETSNATLRFHQHAAAGGVLFELYVEPSRRKAMTRRINRAGGQYHRTHETNAAGELVYYPYDSHWNQAGHNLAAQTIADAMRNIPGCPLQ